MLASSTSRRAAVFIATLIAGLIAGCGPATSTPSVNAPTAIPLATVPNIPVPTGLPEASLDPALAGFPPDITGFELIALRAGPAYYSGYNCTITPLGCACETPVIHQVTFNITQDNHLSYVFAGDGYSAEWLMDDLGPNEWGYTFAFNYETEAGQVLGAIFALMTFTEDGYVLTQGANLDAGGIVTCPDIHFRRIPSPGGSP